ncbi:MAG: glutamine-hydrolyzing carbamoyl-phosphate synthase small subunit [Flavobacteriales bacterium]|jgi:carbamoyl-phosphate synthase small subunit|nr:glutamine-hydrolyzing carbamoyl-phosphate synthase small subunit [Flavobacteriales bacterium]MBK7246740.1 glutamine-hydrolyzing carbamoyl-phosphate synthase small subunit [Flavobacteriales bacterium]MBK9060994.1 glutamine-hydrolyzing carbamoyl-phosphate synthase small subunit [Flavobacteriales bacterium]HQV39255.1 glutamine-hydrolyzing carbamoyl-phosphate synthase small subunit [Flavobacteriales bacterium]HQW32389.1 glutamine-hydrolyzing carbamoyl-phosphate synthase small subunit [Flavobacte
MLVSQRPKAVLLLEDGMRFEGRAIGARGTSVGEICFNTGMTGYQEIFTDPSYTGQVMVMASPHIGNYGVKVGLPNTLEGESEGPKVSIAGLVVKKFSEVWSRPGGTGSLEEFLVKAGVTGISDIDTRMLVRHIRDHGAQNAVIDSTGLDDAALQNRLAEAPDMAGLELSSTVSTPAAYDAGAADAPNRVALVDFGIKLNSIRWLVERDCLVRVFPMHTPVMEMMDWKPDGFLLSNGPGDPGAMPDAVELVKDVVATGLPVFGICLGHQLLAECHGVGTLKMHHGHRGINHPVRNIITGKDEVTSQNHGFVVDREQAEKHPDMDVTHLHLNDGSVAGTRLKGKPVFSVQHHPEAGPGPLDSQYLFDDFVGLISRKHEQTKVNVQHA